MTKRLLSGLALTVAVAVSALAATASIAAAAPVIRVSMLKPDYVTPGKTLAMWVNVIDVGDEPLSGKLTIKYTFPAGVRRANPQADASPSPACTRSGQVYECVIDVTGFPLGRTLIYKTLTFVESSATGILTGEVEVYGGGASNSVTVPLAFDTDPIGPFAVDSLDVAIKDNPALQPAQAGGVPPEIDTGAELRSQAAANFEVSNFATVSPPESMRDAIVHVPPGFVGYPTATPQRCTAAQLATPFEGTAQVPNCPRDSQIGLALVNGKDTVPVYNLVPPRGAPAEFGFFYQGLIVNLRARVRPDDNGIDIVTTKAPSSVPISKFEVQLWGIPTDSKYDPVRAECTEGLYGAAMSAPLCPSTAPRVPFLRMPTSCAGPLPWQIEMDTYQHPGVMHTKSSTTPTPSACDTVPFEPRVALAPTTSGAHATSGLDVNLSVPQDNGPNGISQADVRSAAVSLPQGVGLNPAAAEGLEACTDSQLRLGLEGPAECPEASKLGTVEVKTPLLEETLDGSVYLRSQNSQDPESGQMYRLAIVLHSEERGVDVKLPGSLVVNKTTGQLTTTFDELPQLPFESMHLHLKAGPRAPLTTPQACGSYAAQATLTGWNGAVESVEPSFTINQNCTAPGFAPGFEAGVANPTAGGFSPFILRVTRDSGQPNLSRIEAILPEGELAKLAGVPLCSDAQATTGACPASSRIGKVTTAVGEGTSPIYLPQPGKAPTAVYLAGPYKGAPYSVLAAVPAQSGPFDLGTVLVRSALRVDPITTRATVSSDPLPQIFGGIPVSYRDVGVLVDRPGFTLNPTSCAPQAVEGQIGAANGQSAAVQASFQARDCASLGFKPSLSLKLRGGTKRGGHPALTAVLKARPGDANIAAAQVTLPYSEFLDQGHMNDICTRPRFAAKECPAASIYGYAKAKTPLLDYPLEGPVYLRSNPAHKLPDLVAALRGPGASAIEIDLQGRVDTATLYKPAGEKVGGIRNTFEVVPDAPVTEFTLSMQGGKKGLLENSEDLCSRTFRAIARFTAQNGRQLTLRPKTAARCPKGRRGARHRRARPARRR